MAAAEQHCIGRSTDLDPLQGVFSRPDGAAEPAAGQPGELLSAVGGQAAARGRQGLNQVGGSRLAPARGDGGWTVHRNGQFGLHGLAAAGVIAQCQGDDARRRQPGKLLKDQFAGLHISQAEAVPSAQRGIGTGSAEQQTTSRGGAHYLNNNVGGGRVGIDDIQQDARTAGCIGLQCGGQQRGDAVVGVRVGTHAEFLQVCESIPIAVETGIVGVRVEAEGVFPDIRQPVAITVGQFAAEDYVDADGFGTTGLTQRQVDVARLQRARRHTVNRDGEKLVNDVLTLEGDHVGADGLADHLRFVRDLQAIRDAVGAGRSEGCGQAQRCGCFAHRREGPRQRALLYGKSLAARQAQNAPVDDCGRLGYRPGQGHAERDGGQEESKHPEPRVVSVSHDPFPIRLPH